MPDVASVPEKATPSGRLYQPFASGPRSGTGTTPGSVLSSLIVTLFVIEVPSVMFQAEHVSFVPGVSTLSVVALQPSLCSAPVYVQLTVTLLRYQPFEPGVPTMVTVMSRVTAPALGAAAQSATRQPRRATRRPRRPCRRDTEFSDTSSPSRG